MAGFARLQRNADKLLDKYFEAIRETERQRAQAATKAVVIQRLWRGYTARKALNHFHDQAIHIQRIWRGYLGRRRFTQLAKQKALREDEAYYSAMATIIQKTVRGFLSRRVDRDNFRRNLKKRRQYLQTLHVEGEQMVREVRELADRQAQAAAVDAEKKATAEFEKLTGNMHHLLGTQSRPGVFTSPFGPEFNRTAFGIHVEDHIRDAFENQRARVRMTKSGRIAPGSSVMDSKQNSSRVQQPASQRSTTGGAGAGTATGASSQRSSRPASHRSSADWSVRSNAGSTSQLSQPGLLYNASGAIGGAGAGAGAGSARAGSGVVLPAVPGAAPRTRGFEAEEKVASSPKRQQAATLHSFFQPQAKRKQPAAKQQALPARGTVTAAFGPAAGRLSAR